MRHSTATRFVWLTVVLALLMAACRAPTAPGGAAPSSASGASASAPAPSASGGASSGSPSGGQTPTEIVIGTALPLTGQESRAGGFVRTAYEMAVEEINAGGGIAVAGSDHKLPIRLIVLDDQTDKSLTRSLYERLATVDKVNFFLGGYSTALGVAHAPVADQYKIPYVTGGEAAGEIFSRGQKYVFGTLSSVENLATSTMEWIKYWQDQGTLARPGKIALLWENATHGKEYQRGVQNFVKANPDRFTIVIDEPFQYPGATDHRPLLQKARSAGADFFLVDAHLEDYTLMQRQYAELGMHHQVVSYGARGPEKVARDQLGGAADYVAAANWWSPELPYPASKDFVQRFQAKYQAVPEWYHALAYTAAVTLFKAIELAGSLDREQVRDTLAKTSLDNALIPGGKVYFRADGQIDNPFVITENLPGGAAPIVWPLDAKTGDAVLPVP